MARRVLVASRLHRLDWLRRRLVAPRVDRHDRLVALRLRLVGGAAGGRDRGVQGGIGPEVLAVQATFQTPSMKSTV
jgi:hypothetical protein